MIQKIKTLQIIHLAICAGMILAYAFIGEFSLEKLLLQKIEINDLIYLTIPIGAFILSNFMFKTQLKLVDAKASVENKLPIYQTASIIRWAIIEGGAFLILFIKPDLLVFGIFLILYLIYLRPTEDKIVNDLQSNFK